MKKTQKSLILSLISLVLCFSMLVGTTFAWFTDSVTSAANIIQPGNLDIKMYWSDDLSNWNDVEGDNNKVFNYDNWEPGYTEVKYIKIQNNGSLAFKYSLNLLTLGEVGMLAEVLDVYYGEAPAQPLADRDISSLTKRDGTLKELISGSSALMEGVLLPTDKTDANYKSGEIIVAIALHMQESAGNKYQNQSVGDGFTVQVVATQFDYEADGFGGGYDQNAQWPNNNTVTNGNASADVTVGADNKTTAEITMISADGKYSATVPAGVSVDGNKLTLSVAEVENSAANITLNENENTLSVDVHIDGVAEDNDTVMSIAIKELLPVGLNMGNYRFYHVEDGNTVEMTLLADGATPVHNNYEYDPATGDVVLHLASFSEIALVADNESAWKGEFDYSWYTNAVAPVDGEAVTEYTIANADQLAAFGAIVGGMARDNDGNFLITYTDSDGDVHHNDSFIGKTVKLIADINLGDKESENNPNLIFYPIGYWNNEGTYERLPADQRVNAVSSGFYAFEGTFDGNGNTIKNFYQNTWEMKGDHDWYDVVKDQYFRDGFGLFGKVYGGTVKNLIVDNYSCDSEIGTTGVIAAYADSKNGQPAIFENITITNCNPRVYNIGNGGIVGCAGWYSRNDTLRTGTDENPTYDNAVTFRNITVDQTNKISALWGSWGVSCAGILGQYYPNSACGIKMENCHVAAVIDVNNDVCSNYQYYWYRYAGMFIGTIRANKVVDGYTIADTTGVFATGCTYTMGDWNEYWYCEIVANSLASYTHDHQFSRLEKIKSLSEIQDENGNWNKEGHFVIPAADNSSATCYHIFKNSNGELYQHFHDVADESNPNIYEDFDLNGDGELNDLKEDRVCYFIPFNQLMTGLDMGIRAFYDQSDFEKFGIENIEFKHEENGTVKSEEKFESIANGMTYKPGQTITLGQLVSAKVDESKIAKATLYAAVSPATDNDNTNVSATFSLDAGNWKNSSITLGENCTGAIKIVITDYFYCTPTVIILGAHECVYETIEENRVEATCTEAGSYDKVVRCTECKKELSRETFTIDAPGHSAGPGATCTTAQICTVCETELAPVLGHDHTAVTTAPTCTEKGYTTYTCWCGHSYVADEVAALGHSHSAVVTAPTCTTEGYTTYTCKCGDTYVADKVATIDHDYNKVVTSPTCTADGYTTYTCKQCGDNYTADNVAALGHSFEFESKFNGDFLYRVGNQNTVSLSSLFEVKNYDNISVSITGKTNGVSGTYDANKHEITFTGTGVVTVKVTDTVCKTSVELNLEVVDAKNYPTAYNNNQGNSLNATANNVVLLSNCGISSLAVSGRYTFYGNGFTATYSGDGRYLNNGLKQGVITVQENGTIDNLRVVASIYPYMAFSYSDVQTTAPKEVDGTKTRYYYQLSAVAVSGNATVTNCYIYGGRTNIFIGGGDVTIKDTILECGVAANAQIISSDEYTITLENVTTIQKHVSPTVGSDDEKQNYKMLGLGILLGELDKDNTYTSPKIILNGDFKQYNWASSADADIIEHDYSGYSKTLISQAIKQDAFKRTINGNDAVNLGIVFLNSTNPKIVNNTGLNYVGPQEISIATLKGNVYSLSANASADQVYSDVANADRTTVNDYYKPQFNYPADLGGQYVEKTDDGDEFLYREGDTIKVMFPSGDTKEIDLAALVNIVKYAGQDLNLNITVKDKNGNAVDVTDGKVSLSTEGTYTVTYAVTDTLFYNEDGQQVSKTVNYSWNVTMDVALKDTALPNAEFVFDSSVQKIYRSGSSNIVQFIPFLSGLKIYDYDAAGNKYLRFNGGDTSATTDYNKIAKASIENINTTGEAQGYHIVTVEFTDGGKLVIDMDVRANSGSSTHSGSIKVRNNVIYVVNGGTTSGKGQTWKIYSYKFVGNNGTEINSGLITFGTSGVDCDTATKPSSNFGTTVKYTVTYDANGGNCGQNTGYATSASAAVTLPTPTKSGYIFAGWYTAASGGTRVGGAGESYTPSANITLYAQWGKPCTVTYNANGGSCGTASEKYTGTALTLPTPTRDGYWFIGWYDEAEGGNKVGDAGATYNPSGETTLYAHWQEAIEYTVTYDANGGSCGTANATYQGTALTLPTPTRTGYTFNGWYTAASGGTKIEGPYIPSANIKLYAQWKVNSYNINVTISSATVTINGTQYTGNKTLAFEYGATVEVTLNSFSQSRNKKFSITGITDSISDTTTGKTYTFTMPANEVTINASSSCVTGDTLVTLADGTQKRIDEVTYNDQLLVWNFYTGKYDVVSSALIQNHGYAWNTIIKLGFSDSTVTKAVNEHWYFDATLNEYVMITPDTASEYIGHEFVKRNDDSYTTVTLTSVEISEEYIEAYSILSAYNYNFITDGIFSLTSPVIETNFFMPFEVGEDMTFDEEKMANDIEKYGLYEYADFEDQIPYEVFEALNIKYLKVAVGKGLITKDQIIELLASEGVIE